jgi:hypothetical protein
MVTSWVRHELLELRLQRRLKHVRRSSSIEVSRKIISPEDHSRQLYTSASADNMSQACKGSLASVTCAGVRDLEGGWTGVAMPEAAAGTSGEGGIPSGIGHPVPGDFGGGDGGRWSSEATDNRWPFASARSWDRWVPSWARQALLELCSQHRWKHVRRISGPGPSSSTTSSTDRRAMTGTAMMDSSLDLP